MKKVFTLLMLALATSLTFVSCKEDSDLDVPSFNNPTVETVASPSSVVGKRLILNDDTWVKFNFVNATNISIQHETMTVNGTPTYVYTKTGDKTGKFKLVYSLSDFLGATNYTANYDLTFTTSTSGTYTGSLTSVIPDNDSNTYEGNGTFTLN